MNRIEYGQNINNIKMQNNFKQSNQLKCNMYYKIHKMSVYIDKCLYWNKGGKCFLFLLQNNPLKTKTWKQLCLSKREFSILFVMAYNVFNTVIETYDFQPIKSHVFKMLFYNTVTLHITLMYFTSIIVYRKLLQNIHILRTT